MPPLGLQDVIDYVEANIDTFHEKRLQKLAELRLAKVLPRKNPYLFRAKNIVTAEGFVRSILDAYLSSQEETLFGDFLEGLAVFACERAYGGYKPSPEKLEGIDLIFQNEGHLYIIQIKSGPNWGNSSQIARMLGNFDQAREALQSAYPDSIIIAVNGCSYGREANPDKRNGRYWKLCGQDFWRFISGDDEFYTRIVEPLGHRAKARNEAFQEAYAAVINKFTQQFIEQYCRPDFSIDWQKIVRSVSQRKAQSVYPLGD